LSSVPDLTCSVSVPRLAAIEHPLGYLLGQPGDEAGQLAVLRATLQAVEEMKVAGSMIQLAFVWPEAARRLNAKPPQMPPIAKYLIRHPWQIHNLFARDVPESMQTNTLQRV
jgi:hypothetical protein